MRIVGEEAFAPSNDVTRFGVFTLQSLRFGQLEIEGAGRYERAVIDSVAAGSLFLQNRPLYSYLLDGNIVNSVNFPNVVMPRACSVRTCCCSTSGSTPGRLRNS